MMLEINHNYRHEDKNYAGRRTYEYRHMKTIEEEIFSAMQHKKRRKSWVTHK
jgi:hypothetical protein